MALQASRQSPMLTSQMDEGFLFVACDKGGRAGRSGRTLANRHVQMNYRASCMESATTKKSESNRGQPRMMKMNFARKKKSEWGKKDVRKKPAAKNCPWQDISDTGALDEKQPCSLWGPHNISDSMRRADESRAVYFYAQEVAIDLSGEVESAFWQVYILQRHHQEPVIRQAIVALASTYWEAKKVAAGPLALTSAQQACKAITELRTYLSQTSIPSQEVVLSSALLLYALERLRGDTKAALFHLNNSISIFDAWKRERKTSLHSSEFDVLHATLARIDANATIQDMTRSPKLKVPRRDTSTKPPIFDNAEQMQDWLTVNVCHPLLAFISNAMQGVFEPIPVEEQIRSLQENLLKWRVAANIFCDTRALTPKQELGVLCCESHYLTCKCTIDELLGKPSSWDECLDDVWQVASEAFDIQRRLRASDAETRWALNIGITQPLLRFGQKGTIEPVRTKVMDMVKAYEAFWEYPPMCPTLWKADGAVNVAV